MDVHLDVKAHIELAKSYNYSFKKVFVEIINAFYIYPMKLWKTQKEVNKEIIHNPHFRDNHW